MRRRWPGGAPAHVVKQIDDELALIAELKYEAFFLTVEDIVRFATEQKILCQGRGSSANSAVCFELGITAVDPAESRLLLARFLSKARPEPPDIDVDLEHERREERSEEHTSELQSLMRSSYAVFCLKKKIRKQRTT